MREVLGEAVRILEEHGVEAPREHAERLLAHVVGTNRGGVLARSREPLDAGAHAAFAALVGRRAAREPLQHLLGTWPFLELELKVDRRALIPRPESEDLAQRARRRVPADRPALVADVGTGTGCVALALVSSHPQAGVLALDLSPDALALAAENRAAHPHLAPRVTLVHSDLLTAVGPVARLDAVVANLPYVREDEWEDLQPEVRDHDPRVALVAADAGLALIRRLAVEAAARLAPGGWLLLEMAPAQTGVIADELRAAGWDQVSVVRDHLGRERIVEGCRPAP